MSQPSAIGRIEVEVAASMERMERTPDPDTPFRVLLLGDFTGRSSRGNPTVSDQGDPGPLEIDRDAVDELIERLGAELQLDVPGTESGRHAIRFSALEDFHPDRLVERLDAFRPLRTLRRRLQDPKTSHDAAAEVRASLGGEREGPGGASAQDDRETALSEGQALVRELLEGGGRRAPETTARRDDEWMRFVRGIVGPHLLARADPRQPELIAAVDSATAESMRAILHHPDFQALEAAWRGVDFLVRRLETGSDLQLWLLDVSKDDLWAAFAASNDPGGNDAGAKRIARILVDEAIGTPGVVPWALIAGNYTFDASAEDVAVLSSMARLARAAGAPFLAGASPRLLGCESLDATPDPDDWRPLDEAGAKRWNVLRASRDAAYLGLALPRFLLRVPYGKGGDRPERFDFEELPGGAPHESHLWGNPAIACVSLLGRAFSDQGWRLRAGAVQEIDDLPLHVYERDGTRRVKPCAEVLLTLRAAEIILERGLMPLLSFRDRDVVRLARFQSVRFPLTALAGRWSG